MLISPFWRKCQFNFNSWYYLYAHAHTHTHTHIYTHTQIYTHPWTWRLPAENPAFASHCPGAKAKIPIMPCWPCPVAVQSLSHVQPLCNPMDCSPPVCSTCGVSQARILEWAAISFSRQPCMIEPYFVYHLTLDHTLSSDHIDLSVPQ